MDITAPNKQIDPEMYNNKKFKLDASIAKNILGEVIPYFEALKDWTEDNLHQATTDLATKLEVKAGAVYTVMRIALSACLVTPGGSVEIADILGKAESIRRLKEAYSWL